MNRVLVIDDDEQVREMLRRMLEYEGLEVLEAGDGEEGLRLFADSPVQLVITDILMPNKEGLETIMGLRRKYPQLPIIAISGGGFSGSLDYLSTANKLGATLTIAKPFTRQQMIDAVNKVLDAHAAE